MAYNHDGLVTGTVFFLEKPASHHGLDAQALEEIAADILKADLLGRRCIYSHRGRIGIGDSDQALEESLFAGEPAVEIRSDRRCLDLLFGNAVETAVDITDAIGKILVGPFNDAQRL